MDAYYSGRFADAGLIKRFRKSAPLSKSVSQSLIFRITGMIFVFILQMMLANWMGPKNFGDYAVILTIVNLFIGFSMMGFDATSGKLLPGYVSAKDYGKVQGLAKFSVRTVITAAVIFSLAMFLFLLAESKKFSIGFSEGMFWALLMIPFLAALHQYSSVIRAMNRIKTSMLPLLYIFPVLMTASCAVYFSYYKKLSVDAAMLINLGCTLVMFFYMKRKSQSVLKIQSPSDKPEYEKKAWFSIAGIMFLTTTIDLLLRQTDVLMISYYLGNTIAGYYSVAVRLAMFAGIGVMLTDQAFLPKMAELFSSKKLVKLQQFVRTSSMQVLSISLPVTILLLMSGKWILSVFGAGFSSAFFPFVILLISQLINTALGMSAAMMIISGKQKTFLFFYLLAFVAELLMNIFLIPRLGITGAAIGSSVSCILLNVLSYKFIKTKLKIKGSFL